MGVKDTLLDLFGVAQKTATTAVDTGKAAVEMRRLEKAAIQKELELAALIEKKYHDGVVEMPQDAAHLCADLDALRDEIAALKSELNTTKTNAVNSIRNAGQKSVETIRNAAAVGAETVKEVGTKGVEKARSLWESKEEPLCCPECGTALRADYAFCPICGAELEEVDENLEELDELEPEQSEEAKFTEEQSVAADEEEKKF